MRMRLPTTMTRRRKYYEMVSERRIISSKKQRDDDVDGRMATMMDRIGSSRCMILQCRHQSCELTGC